MKTCQVCGKPVLKPEPTWIVCKSCYFNKGAKRVTEASPEEQKEFEEVLDILEHDDNKK